VHPDDERRRLDALRHIEIETQSLAVYGGVLDVLLDADALGVCTRGQEAANEERGGKELDVSG
jgi:hypothetical protein